jgi:hypothetical protein
LKNKTLKKSLGIVFRDGKPSAVILDIGEYKKMLTRLEDIKDLKMLEKIRKKPLKYKKLEDLLEENGLNA